MLNRSLEVVVVEDELLDIQMYKRAFANLEEISCSSKFFSDGERAQSYLAGLEAEGPDAIPDVILLDLNMPKVNGKDILKFIKTSELLRNRIVVIVSSSDDEEEMRLCYELGANAYIPRPLTREKLQELFNRLFGLIYHHVAIV
ncbi:MAG: response regulator [Candidatus Eisenbacteria bacterium]|uniref:Response regulator n=1 Tax=Eiseniibacteriota bacterium TaxID=2212470 RepID=A0A7Y2E842_UNCEI|nr:response regulator [Candidatus Eisenbacteria bacterium]